MKRIALVATIALVSYAFAQNSDKVIYGTDDRQEVVDTLDNLMVEKSRSVAGMFSSGSLSLQTNGTYKVSGGNLISRGFCASERFSKQVTAPTCTGFLVAPDIIATAGHCVSKNPDCKNNLWAFDFKLSSSTDLTTTIPKNSVYKCKSIITSVQNSSSKNDYALIRLDRAVTDRMPLEIRRSGKIPDSTSLVLIGHPKGLPLKIAPGGIVRANTATNYFVTTTDSYAGNSGSPIFDARTGVVEGILVRGEADYVTSGGCYVSKVCAENSCAGEDATRITNLPAFK